MNYTFVALAENKPGVLNRVASLFRRRNFNIESITAGRTESPNTSRITIVVDCPNGDIDAHRIEANLYKLVNVIDVQDVTHQPSVTRDLALIKVRVGPERRAEVNGLAEIFRARIVDVASDSLIVEITGTEDKIESMIELLRPIGIVEVVRTGQIAMTRGVNDGVRRVAGTNGNRYEDVMELAEMAP
ncbi:MAG TPA: acetolactate synthase small subunit [Anaerolineales bacterium]|jgi:acetolactate synthase I/III small subunit|nr:acetolactate synthase small subunit [Anaerolineales bacterium]HEX5837945.1 acetolactate synthase small subunit [Anaerolineales bacterium]